MLNKIQNIATKYPHPMRFWLGPKLMVVFSDPGHVEVNTNKIIICLKHMPKCLSITFTKRPKLTMTKINFCLAHIVR